MTTVLGLAMLATFGWLGYKMYKIDKERRDREAGYEDGARREKQNRIPQPISATRRQT